MKYDNKQTAQDMLDKFLAVNGSWCAYLCFAGTNGNFSLVRSSDYKDKGCHAELTLSVYDNSLTLLVYNRATERMEKQTAYLRHNIVRWMQGVITDYHDKINGYKEW